MTKIIMVVVRDFFMLLIIHNNNKNHNDIESCQYLNHDYNHDKKIHGIVDFVNRCGIIDTNIHIKQYLMPKKLILFILISFLLITPVFAQEKNAEADDKQEKIEKIEKKLEPIIKAEEFIEIGKKAIFDASDSITTVTGTPGFAWNFGDNTSDSGKDVVHVYNKIGKYTITLTVVQGIERKQIKQQLFVYDKKALLIIDEKKEEEINQLKLQAAENGMALKILSTAKEEGGFLSEEKLVKEITQVGDHVKGSDVLIFYTKTSLGIQSFTRFWQNLSDKDKDIVKNKLLISVTDSNMEVVSNFAYQAFKIIQPKYILLTRKEALNPLFTTKDFTKFTSTLEKRGIEYQIIDERGEKSAWFLLSNLITSFISKGVSASSIYLILMIPFLACVVVFFRQLIGLSTFGIYAPVITAASFYILGIRFGLITFLFAVIVGYLMKYILNKIELSYLSKVALNLGLISLSFLIVVWLILISEAPIAMSVAVFPILVMSSIAEKFMAAQSEEGFRGALFGVLETLIVVIACYYLITWTLFNNIVMSWPELVVAPLLLILLIGRFSGLRLSEYLRFRSLFSEHTEE